MDGTGKFNINNIVNIVIL